MLAHARGVQQELRIGAGPRLPGNFCDSFAPLTFLLLLWDVQGRHRKSFCIPTPLPSSPARCPRGPGPGSPHTSPGLGTSRRGFSRAKPRPRSQAPPRPPRAPPPPSPAPQPESPDVGFHPCAWSFISIKGQRSAGPRLRPPPPPAALPRGARRPGPTRARAAPAGARPAGEQRGGGGGRLRAVLRGGGRGGERGWGGGRGGRRDSISGGGRGGFSFP